MKLFAHNQQAYEQAVALLAETGKAAVIHPTGTGKSFIAFQLCADNQDATICWLSPSEYIFSTQMENWIAAGGERMENIRFFTYAKLMFMDDTQLAEIQPDYIILDEFHRCGAELWGQGVQRLLAQYPDAPILGLTATHIRYLDNQRDMAEELFDGNIASEMTLGEAIVRGILQPPKYILSVYSYQKDLERYQRRVRQAKNKATRDAGERYLEALRRAIEKADGLDVIFDKHMTDRTGKYIVFCADKEHMDEMLEHAGEWFCKVDQHPHIYTLYTPEPETSQSFKAFKGDSDSGHLRLLYAIDALNEGIHVEDVNGVILLRPTVSPIVYKQQIGRTLSASKSKEPVIFDIVNNIENLYSIGAIEEEMRVATTYYRYMGEGQEIVNETFKVFDEVRDCRELFEQLDDTLSASWEQMYRFAKAYFEANDHLDVPRRYKTEEGYALGSWLHTQRKVRSGEQFGRLDAARIGKLDAIGMRWESVLDVSWGKNFAVAQEFYEANGHLSVPRNYMAANGLRLGQWVSSLRSYRKSNIRTKYLTEERIADLDAIGMVWNQPDFIWERNFGAALEYYRQNGNLNVPNQFTTKDGVKLGIWLARLRTDAQLTEIQRQRLDEIGMTWANRHENKWQRHYEAARAYFQKHGNLDVPVAYVTEDGLKLGTWLGSQKDHYRTGKLRKDRIVLLEALGIVWKKDDAWEVRYRLAKQYFTEHGNLKVPANYVVDGVWLGKWISEQRQVYQGKRQGKELTAEQIRNLEAIGMDWRENSDRSWLVRYELVKAFYQKNGHLPTEGEDSQLSDWLSVQRQKKLQSKLTDQQIEKLENLGLLWNTKNTVSIGLKSGNGDTVYSTYL